MPRGKQTKEVNRLIDYSAKMGHDIPIEVAHERVKGHSINIETMEQEELRRNIYRQLIKTKQIKLSQARIVGMNITTNEPSYIIVNLAFENLRTGIISEKGGVLIKK